jgi:hypothetical protein
MAHLTGVGAYREQTKNEYQVKNAGKAKKNPGSAKSNPSRPGVAVRRTASLPLAYVEERRRFRLPMSKNGVASACLCRAHPRLSY